ncbi:MAG TPA: hypothetical protein VMW48_08500, partial [Vicinamibacterales bacterium]|nr:hypothetical protein [Vicinamibacterales bacterium]
MRKQEITTPEFEAPFSLTPQANKAKAVQPDLFAGKGSGTASKGTYAEGQPVTAGSVVRPVEFPELVELARTLQNTPAVVKRFRGEGTRGTFSPGGIRLHADLFKAGQEQQLAATLAHEIGHLVDWLPDQNLKRGNLLGRLRSLRSFLKHTFTAEDGQTIKLAEVRQELLALSAEWRPWDEATSSKSFNTYRKSSKELYADALSVLLNNPGMLSQKAPIFYQQFFEQLDAKPDVRRAYEDLQDVLAGTPEALVARRRAGVRQMFEAGDTKALDIEKRRQAEAKERKRNLWFRLKTHLVDRNYAVIDRVNALQKQGIQIPEDEDPRYLLEERNYLGGKLKGFADRAFSPVFDTLREAGISWADFGEALFYERIIAGDRSEIANPRGLSVKTAQELYDTLKADLGPEKTAILTSQMVTFRSGLKEAAESAYQAGLYTDEQHTLMQANPAYVTFQVLDHLEDRLTSRVYRQIGTLKDIANPADASILKTLATIRATERNRMIRGVVDFLQKQFPGDIQPARTKWNGKTQEPVESKDPNQHLIEYYDKGKRTGVYVDEYLAGAINKETIGRNLAPLELLRAVNAGFFRPVFTTFNLGFQSFNVVRDLLRTWKNAPGMSLGRLLSRYKQAAPLAKARAFDKGTDRAQADLVAAEEAGILSVTFNDLIAGRDVEDSQIEDILTRLGVQGYQVKRHAPAYQFLLSALGAIRNTGDFIETLPKAAMIYEYRGEGAISDISPAQRSFIRRKIGSPDFLAGGTAKPITNELFLFSNAITQALRSDIEVATDPTTRAGFWWKTATLNLIPKILMFAAIMGAFGETVRRLMQKSTEYDRTNYTVLPLGEDKNGNAVYIRLPQDDVGRIFGGLLWKAMRAGIGDQDALKTLAQVADYSVGVFPSVTPTVELLQQSAQFVAGQNPY